MCTINFFSFSAPGRFDLQQVAYTLERAFLPARVILQRGEKLVCINDVDLDRVGLFGLRTRFWKEEKESV